MSNLLEKAKSFAKTPKGQIAVHIAFERITTGLSFLLDILMISIIATDAEYGMHKAFLCVTPMYAVLCIGAVYVNDWWFKVMGYEIAGVDKLILIKDEEYDPKQYFKRILKWMLSRRFAIFWLGSWWKLDPIYVTLLLRENGKGFWKKTTTMTTTTIPSVILSMVVHTFIWKGAVEAYGLVDVNWFSFLG